MAVSWYRSEYTLRAIQMLLDAGVKTNIHYVLGNNSIDEANMIYNPDYDHETTKYTRAKEQIEKKENQCRLLHLSSLRNHYM